MVLPQKDPPSVKSTIKRIFGLNQFLKNPYIIGALVTLLIGALALQDCLEPDVALSTRNRELYTEQKFEAKDEQALEELMRVNPLMAQQIKERRDFEKKLAQAQSLSREKK